MKKEYSKPEAELLAFGILYELLADSFGNEGIEGFEDIGQEW